MKSYTKSTSYLFLLISMVALMVGLSNPALAGTPSGSFVAGTSAGWDFHAVGGDIARNNTVDLGDLSVIAQNWLSSGCGSANQWCTGADLDDSTGVDLIDYALLAGNFGKQAGQNILLQTIYGTAQNSAGQITANGYRALQNTKGMAMAFAVPQATALDTGTFKLLGLSAGHDVEVRLYNVTGKGYLTYNHGPVSRSDPGAGGTNLMDITLNVPSPAPYHSEGTATAKFSDMVINFGPLEVTAGEYLLVFDCISTGTSLTTACSMVKGLAGTAASAMGTYPDGTALPKRAIVTTSTTAGNTYYYYLGSGTDLNYGHASDQFACQITTTIVNHAPQVNAGQSQLLAYPNDTANLDGTVTDDGNPNPPGVLTTTWSKVSGPGTVTFGDASAIDTTATFSEVGTYVLRLTASDGELSDSDDVIITYAQNTAPVVNAGTDLTVGILDVTNLNGSVVDDGLPNPPATVTSTWTQTSGPGTATFGDANNVNTSVSFSATGTYVLRLTASDSDLSAYDEVTVNVVEGSLNNAPVVNAGPDQSIQEGGTVTLSGTVTDDGKPNPPANVTVAWSVISGPNTVTFANPNAASTTATIDNAGTYVLRLTANDSALSSYDEITVTVNPFGSYQGYGAGTTGGRGGKVIMVTNVLDSGAGSFSAALGALDGSPTIIKFSVGGTIHTSGNLYLQKDNVTIMGSTAPAPGITVDCGFPSSAGIAFNIKASNVIVENIRFRNAAVEDIQIWGNDHIVIDHCSVTWCGDGGIDINGADAWGIGTHHVTISRCLIGGVVEASRSHGHQITWMYNMFSHNNRRQPKIAWAGPDYDFICNYQTQWCNTGLHIQLGQGGINLINNYWGPPYPTESWTAGCFMDAYVPNSTPPTVDPNNVYTAGNAYAPDAPGRVRGGVDFVNTMGKATAPLVVEAPPVAVTIIDGNDVPANVTADVGAKPTDAHDLAYISGSYTGRDRGANGNPP